MITCESPWWTSGFYPGTLWYCYEYSNDPQVRMAAEEMTSRVEKQKYTTNNHDVGLLLIVVLVMVIVLHTMRHIGK